MELACKAKDCMLPIIVVLWSLVSVKRRAGWRAMHRGTAESSLAFLQAELDLNSLRRPTVLSSSESKARLAGRVWQAVGLSFSVHLQVLLALEYLHCLGFVYRDLKVRSSHLTDSVWVSCNLHGPLHSIHAASHHAAASTLLPLTVYATVLGAPQIWDAWLAFIEAGHGCSLNARLPAA